MELEQISDEVNFMFGSKFTAFHQGEGHCWLGGPKPWESPSLRMLEFPLRDLHIYNPGIAILFQSRLLYCIE